MSYDEAVAFLRAKFELIAENSYREEFETVVRDLARKMEGVFTDPRTKMASLRSLDGSLETMFLKAYVLADDVPEVRRQLVARFGRSRLQTSGKIVVQRVLKRGEINDAEEYHRVKEFLASVENIKVVGEENYAILDSMADSFQPPSEAPAPAQAGGRGGRGKSAIRKPFPPFDLVLAADEKLCPAETPLRVREEFLQAKAEGLAGPCDRPGFEAAMRSIVAFGVEFSLGPNTPDSERELAFAHVEHELDSATALMISGPQYWATEQRLEARFGFRRLGPSDQARIARLLATDDIPSWRERLVVERFFQSYPHQTLFPRGTGDALLKRRPRVTPKPAYTPRPAIPPDESQLEVGAVFQTKHDNEPYRVIAFDRLEVFYDASVGEGAGWLFGEKARRICYYRMVTPLFLDGADKLWVEPVSREYTALHRPDLPLRFGRSAGLQWREEAFPTREALVAHVTAVDPAWLKAPVLNAKEIALIPRSPKGAWKPAVLIKAENGSSFTMIELLWQAQRLQRPLAIAPHGGIGFYRAGLAKKGVPSFLMQNATDPAMEWHAEAPIASAL